jgi:serine/threonine protein kinase
MTPRSKEKLKLKNYITYCFEKNSKGLRTSIEFYRIGKILGKGAFGKVNLAIQKLTNELVAIKSINK